MSIGERMPSLAATAPMATRIKVKSDAHGTKKPPGRQHAQPGRDGQRVTAGLKRGEGTIACMTNITSLHSVNISAN